MPNQSKFIPCINLEFWFRIHHIFHGFARNATPVSTKALSSWSSLSGNSTFTRISDRSELRYTGRVMVLDAPASSSAARDLRRQLRRMRLSSVREDLQNKEISDEIND